MSLILRSIVVDDEHEYQELASEVLKKAGFEVHADGDAETLLKQPPNADLIVLDNKYGDGGSYWNEYLDKFRKRHPLATVLLVSGVDEEVLREEIKGCSNQLALRILETDPHVVYFPKSLEEDENKTRLKEFADSLCRHIRNRVKLQQLLIEAAFESARRIHAEKIGTISVKEKGKEDTIKIDTIAEHCLREKLSPVMNTMNVVICTEEIGIHNTLYHRVPNPEFYVFSDPFDGSKQATFFANEIVDGKDKDQPLGEVVAKTEYMEAWKKMFGAPSLNSPMVSMVLSERHRIVAAILINLFTSEVYVSVDEGMFFRKCLGFRIDPSEISGLVNSQPVVVGEGGNGAETRFDGWTELRFRDYGELRGVGSAAPLGESRIGRLFLCSLGAVKRRGHPPSRTWLNRHAEFCLSPMIPPEYDWIQSLEFRLKQHDFTPGPGRVLFLTESPAVHIYEESSLTTTVDDTVTVHRYECILSAGEPLTEWIGWFAFLRHAKGISAYCLREKDHTHPSCNHTRDEHDPASMLPNEINSIFRDGYIDIGVLHTAYGAKMARYKDTILVAYDLDDAWKSVLKKDDGTDVYVRIPLFQLA